MSAERCEVAIVGAGIGGLATAVALRRAGVAVKVFERAQRLEPLGAGLSLWPNAVRALRSLGVADAVQDGRIPRGDGGLWRWDGTPLATDDAAAIERRYGAPLVLVHRAELHRALMGPLDEGDVVLGESLTSYEQDPSGVRATFDSGSVVEADLLIGADGLLSAVRAQLLGDEPPRYSGLIAYRAVVEHDAPRPIGEFWGPGGVFGVVPLSERRVYWYATRHHPDPGEDHAPAQERRGLLDAFGGWCEPIPDLLARTPERDIMRHPLFDRPPRSGWTDGRVALLGDAAHPMLPFLGQGACQGLEDAVALGAAARATGVGPAALTAYETARRARASMLVRRSRAAGRIAHLSPAWQRRLRDAALHRTPTSVRRRQLDAVLGTEA
jgi:2-polyprenyl-6-methoxyphenol hydroxylase-like FAD-dependent oxidoreductase